MDDTAPNEGGAPLVVALGGNTLLSGDETGTFDEQLEVIAETASRIAETIAAGYDVVLTHGNGPQVGNLLLQQERVAETPQLPLDVVVAETQAQIGYLLQQALDNELDTSRDFMTIVTQVVVDEDDPAFEHPTKPIGPWYSEAEAAKKSFETREVATGDHPYRRVVPSPEPMEVVESEEIARLIDREKLVIAAGGGGVPVVRDGELRGVEAVVDKDKTSQVLANRLGAETFVILTDVEHAYVDWNQPDERPLRDVSPDELRAHLDDGNFGEGSMRPKIEACLRFLDAGGKRAVITSPDQLNAAVEGSAGTQIQ
jgi:carbamate kinase